MDSVLFLVISFLLGALIFYAVGRRNGRKHERDKLKTVGTLRIDSSDPDGPYIFLELSRGVGDIRREEFVNLKVNTDSYISQK